MPTITTEQVMAGLLTPGLRWGGSVVTVSVPGSGAVWPSPAYGPTAEPFNQDFGVLSAAQGDAFMAAAAAWDRVTSLTLMQVADSPSTQIRVAFTDVSDYGQDGAAAYAYLPPVGGSVGSPLSGDIWVDDQHKPAGAGVGSFLYETFLHELGHTLGLKHPEEGMPLLPDFDSTRWTVMSNNRFEDNRLKFFEMEGSSLFARSAIVSISTPMVLDIIAVQSLYGASNDAELGNNTYTFDQGFPFMMTLVDNGGVDTFDLSSHSRGSIVNLTAGAFSSVALFPIQAQIEFWAAQFSAFFRPFITDWIDRPDSYTWADNVATSLETIIENVLGGGGADTVTGNAAANSVSGGGGGDRILGGAGHDTIQGGDGEDFLRGEDGDDSIVGGAGFDDTHGNMGDDTVAGGGSVDFVVGGQGHDMLFGDDGDDAVLGNLGNDTVEGGAGGDVVRGGQGDDVARGGDGADFVSGDRGTDTLSGGAGADIFHTFAEAGSDRVLDFNAAEGDRVNVLAGNTFTAAQVGADTVVSVTGGAQLVLVGVQLSALPAGWIFS